MARKHPKRRASSFKAERQVHSLEEAYGKINVDELPPVLYANHVRFQANANEFLMDLYNVAPLPGKDNRISLKLLQRVAVPHHLAKGFVTAFANVIAFWEEADGITLLNQREIHETDRIVIWENEPQLETTNTEA